MSRPRAADGAEMVHSVRRAPNYGLIIKTRCGIEVTRRGGPNALRTHYRSVRSGEDIDAAPADSLKPVTCNSCRSLLGLPMMGDWGHGKPRRKPINQKQERN